MNADEGLVALPYEGWALPVPTKSCWRTIGWDNENNKPLVCAMPSVGVAGLCEAHQEEMRGWDEE